MLGLFINGAKKLKMRPLMIEIKFEIIPSPGILIYLLVHNLKLKTELSRKNTFNSTDLGVFILSNQSHLSEI